MVRLSYCSKGSKNCMEGQRKTSLTAAPLVTLTEEDWHSWCIRVWRNSVMVKVSCISETIIGVWNTAAVVCHVCWQSCRILRSSLFVPSFILTREARGRCAREEMGRKEFLFSLSLPPCRESLPRRLNDRLRKERPGDEWASQQPVMRNTKTHTQITRQGHPTLIFGKYLFGRRFEN